MASFPRYADWSGLTQHLLGVIFDRLSLPDFTRSRAVCKSWLLAATNETRPDKTRPLFLMLAGDKTDENSEFRNILSPSDNRTYRLHLPQIRGRRCIGSAESWLVTVDNVAELYLFNPFTGAENELPSITTLSVIQGDERDAKGNITGYILQQRNTSWVTVDIKDILGFFYHRAIIFPSASNDDASPVTVFIIYNFFQELAFARLGDEHWTELKTSCGCFGAFTDVVLHKGQYYGAISEAGYCTAFDVSFSPPRTTFTIGPLYGKSYYPQKFYLVETLDGNNLLHIWRHEGRGRSPDGDYGGEGSSKRGVFETQGFTVSKLDMEGMKMIKLERLEEGTAIFLGNNRSMMLKTGDLPELKENCIYFTDAAGPRRKRQDVGVFNMKDGSVQPLHPPDSLINRLTWPPPVWLAPRLA